VVALTWVLFGLHLGVAGSIATVGSLNVHWWWQYRSERSMGYTGMLCWCVALTLIVGALGISFPSQQILDLVLPVRAVLIGITAAVFLITLNAQVRLPARRAAVVASVTLPLTFAAFAVTGDLAYVIVDGSPWPRFRPLGDLLVGGSVLLLASYVLIALGRLPGARRRQFAFATTSAGGLVMIAIGTGPGLIAEAMTTLWTVPIAVLLACWCSLRVLTLQGSLVSAVAGQQEAERAAQYQARHDQLTGLPNRTGATEKLDNLLAHASAAESIAVFKVKVNRLDNVRAAAGALTADTVLRGIARHLVDVLPPGAEVARVGEVTFVVMIPGPRNRPMTALQAGAERAVLMLRSSPDFPTELTVVVGVAISAVSSTGLELLQQAGVAVTAAEQAHREVQIYRPELRDAIVQRARTLRLLTVAIDHDEFELHYQPVVDTTSLIRVGVEALVRWRHHGRLHPPAEWIPIAEQQGLMPAIGLSVLRIAARDQATLGCPIAVNVSPRQLADPNFAADVLTALQGCPPAAVILEITETSIMADMDQARVTLEALRQHGVRIALDDFGTKHSSLSRLADLPFDILKIDRSFVTRILSTQGRAMVTAIHAMARALGKTTVAEGVETPEQLLALTEIGCDHVQGFLTGRPAPLENRTPTSKSPATPTRAAINSNPRTITAHPSNSPM
jgi:diguanylate cyclase (GGDEF)-like protein